MRNAILNGGLWGIGNGLAGSSLAIYLALELNAPQVGLSIGMLLAAPRLVGVLRLGAPLLIGRVADRKQFCLYAYFISAWLLLSIPLLAAPGRFGLDRPGSLFLLVTLWCLYHLCEYLGTVALWSWLADLVPQRVRGKFLGYRERWMLAGQIVAMLAGAGFVYGATKYFPSASRWEPYALLAMAGALFMVAAILPLSRIPALAGRAGSAAAMLSRQWLPLVDRRFWRLLAFGCFFSLVNGVTQSAQGIYPRNVLEFTLAPLLVFGCAMRFGQATTSPFFGAVADRLGNRPVLIVCQLIVATGPLFYFLATPEQPWWLWGAWMAWIAYAGLNVGLPNLLLKLSRPPAANSYIAVYFAASGLCYGGSTLLGGMLYDWFGQSTFAGWDFFQCSFIAGWLLRTASVLLLFAIVEPGAKPLGQWLPSRPRAVAASEPAA